MPLKDYTSGDQEPLPPGSQSAKQPASAANANANLAALIAKVEATRFDPDKPPPKEPWVFTLASVEIAHLGNIITIAAAVKAGKSSVLCAMIASMMGPADRDYLGFAGRNPEGKAVLHFDTEQSRGDHYAMMMTLLGRAGITVPPPWFFSYSLVGLDPQERRKVIRAMARRAAESGGLLAVFIDGVADLLTDVNEPKEANELVGVLHQWASEFACLIVCALHHNPGTEKTRGHLGSQIERKSESVLMLRKADGIISISCQPARHEEVTGDKAPCFTWSIEAGRHVSSASKAASKDDRKRADLAELAGEVFAGKAALRWGELQAAIMKARVCVESTASKAIKEMRRLEVIARDDFGNLSVKGP